MGVGTDGAYHFVRSQCEFGVLDLGGAFVYYLLRDVATCWRTLAPRGLSALYVDL